MQRLSNFRSGGSGAAPVARSFGGFGGGSRIEAIIQRDLGGEGRHRAKKAPPPCSALRSPTGERLAARGVQHRIEGDHPSLQVEILRQLAHGRVLVGFRADLQLPENQAAGVLDLSSRRS